MNGILFINFEFLCFLILSDASISFRRVVSFFLVVVFVGRREMLPLKCLCLGQDAAGFGHLFIFGIMIVVPRMYFDFTNKYVGL